jgi:anthranilate synthase/aminodeoxychorismate synthase-like glutamine amidotransferase
MKILILDNYDSFTFNLYQYIGELVQDKEKEFVLDVVRNNELTLVEIQKRNYDKVIISPGPGDPGDKKYFGICADVITTLGKTTPILGVCLGMQGIAHCFGGKIIKAGTPMHGKTSLLTHDGLGVFKNLPQKIEVMRYHSLIVEKKSLPSDLVITSVANDTKEIMGLRHKIYPIEGIQFHPESFATDGGKRILKNFLFT